MTVPIAVILIVLAGVPAAKDISAYSDKTPRLTNVADRRSDSTQPWRSPFLFPLPQHRTSAGLWCASLATRLDRHPSAAANHAGSLLPARSRAPGDQGLLPCLAWFVSCGRSESSSCRRLDRTRPIQPGADLPAVDTPVAQTPARPASPGVPCRRRLPATTRQTTWEQ